MVKLIYAVALAFCAVAAFGKESVSVLRVPDGGIQPQVVRDSTGTLHLLYYKGDPANGDLFYTTSKDDGNTWNKAIRVNRTQGDAVALGAIRGGQLAIGKDGRPYVVWLGSKNVPAQTKEGMGLLFSRLKDDKSAFEPERNLQGNTYDMDGGASIAASPAGDVWVAWHAAEREGLQDKDRRVFITHSGDGGKTFEKEHPVWSERTGACACCSLKIIYGTKLWLLYRSAEANESRDPFLLSSTDKGQSFQGQRISDWLTTRCPMSLFSLQELNGRIYAGWERYRVVMWVPSGGDTSKIVGVDAKYPSLGVNSKGDVIIAFADNMAGQETHKVAWQVYRSDGMPGAGENGSIPGLPQYSFPAAFVRSDGGFGVIY